MPCTRLSKLRLAAMAASLVTGGAPAGELRPLPTPPIVSAQPPTAEQRSELERYYQEFTLRSRPLNAGQRAQLTRDFETLRQTAEQAGRAGEAAHYARLIAILVQTRP